MVPSLPWYLWVAFSSATPTLPGFTCEARSTAICWEHGLPLPIKQLSFRKTLGTTCQRAEGCASIPRRLPLGWILLWKHAHSGSSPRPQSINGLLSLLHWIPRHWGHHLPWSWEVELQNENTGQRLTTVQAVDTWSLGCRESYREGRQKRCCLKGQWDTSHPLPPTEGPIERSDSRLILLLSPVCPLPFTDSQWFAHS